MTTIGALLLLRPLWLIAVPALLALTILAARRGDGMVRLRRLIDPALLPALREMGFLTSGRRDLRPWLLGGAAALLATALAGPATLDPEAPTFRNRGTLLVALDLSPSVAEGGGLDDAQAAISRVLDLQDGRSTALLLFTSEPFLVSVPTEETAQLQTTLAVLDGETMPVGGSRPERALAAARAALRDAAAEGAEVILVSDGGGLGPETVHEARLLGGAGIGLSTLYVAPTSLPYGAPPPRPEALAGLRQRNGVSAHADDLAPLERHLARRGDTALAAGDRRAILYDDHGRWLVGAALVPMLPLFRRRRR